MDNSKNSFVIKETPSSIVRIAYSQLSIMTGMRDLAEPQITNGNKLTKEDDNTMVCRSRFELPVIASIMPVLCHTYKTVKQSHETITTIFDNVENGLSKGMEYACPLTNRIGETLEIKMKEANNAICVSLDYLKEKEWLAESLTYQDLNNKIRQAISSVIQTSVILFTNIVTQVNRLEASMDKTSENDKNSNNTEKSK